jgi:16S rRNA (cytosine967-C5)-methyltransferase
MPEWLVESFLNDYGQERTEQLLTSVNEAPKQSARVNTVMNTVEEAIETLTAEGFTVERSAVSPVGLLLSGGHVASSDAFANGLVTLQDESAMLMAPAMTLTENMQVLDAAAAPGGKTTQIATYLDPAQGGMVTALDIHEHKVSLIEDNAARLAVAKQVDARLLDARKVDEAFEDATFDRILVDAPCSGFGLLRRKPEIRYDKSIEDSQNLQRIQLAILDAVADKVKVNGDIVYGTCTILKLENTDVVDAFLATHDDFEVVPTFLDNDLDVRTADGSVQILPDDFGSDGFFIATLRRTK